MEKLLNILGLNKPMYKISDFETNLIMHYIVNFILDIALAIFIIIFAVSTKYTHGIFVFIAILLILVAMHAYNLLQLLGGQVVYFEGICKTSNKSVTTIFKTQFFGKSNIEVEFEGKTYLVPVRHNAPFKNGSMVRVYLIEDNIYQKDEDTFTVTNPIYVSKIKNPQGVDNNV